MLIAGVVIETLPGRAPEVALRLASRAGVRVEGGDGDRRLAVVVRGGDGSDLERWAEALVREDEAILGVFPTYVGEDGGA